jgi:hypothetical protein
VDAFDRMYYFRSRLLVSGSPARTGAAAPHRLALVQPPAQVSRQRAQVNGENVGDVCVHFHQLLPPLFIANPQLDAELYARELTTLFDRATRKDGVVTLLACEMRKGRVGDEVRCVKRLPVPRPSCPNRDCQQPHVVRTGHLSGQQR